MAAMNRAMSARTFADSAAAQAPLILTADIKQVGEMRLARWQLLAAQLLDIGVIKAPVTADTLFVDL